MAIDKAIKDEIRHEVQEAGLAARSAKLDEAERRLRELADRMETRENASLNRHAEIMRSILSSVSLLATGAVFAVTILGFFSKSEVNEEVRDMRAAVNYETQRSELRFDKMKTDFQQQFNTFTGDASKRPRIAISVSTGLLTNQVLHIIRGPNPMQVQNPFYPLFIKNVGDKATGPLSISLYSSAPFMVNGNSQWAPDASNDPEFPYKYHFDFGRTAMVGLAPGEPLSIEGDYSDFQFGWNSSTNLALCKIVVFCSNENPSEARFQLKNGP